ncbi:MAG: metal-dependent hydrolase [Variovorax sp.]|jgi:inner membrane protein|nr:MAG: metal-dependent hydrolase [Variovorax sp.]
MDSLTQIVLGGAVAAAIAPARQRRAALLAGAALGTLPDLDGLLLKLFTDDPVTLMTMHRSFSHSLLVLPFVGLLIWWLFRRRGGRVGEAPGRWFWAIELALVTHPLLDAFTVYGTQLWWPLPTPPVSWSSIFIIDPAYTLWLLAACVYAWWAAADARARRPLRMRRAQQALVGALAISSIYLGGSLLARQAAEREADRALAALGLADAPRLAGPTPLNTLLWRVVALTPTGYLEGEHSLIADRGPMAFRAYPSDTRALGEAGDVPAVRRLAWFNGGFMRAQRTPDGLLVLSDLRMGEAPSYTFQFEVARSDGTGRWRAIPPRQQPWKAPIDGLGALWHRIWNEPRAPTP